MKKYVGVILLFLVNCVGLHRIREPVIKEEPETQKEILEEGYEYVKGLPKSIVDSIIKVQNERLKGELLLFNVQDAISEEDVALWIDYFVSRRPWMIVRAIEKGAIYIKAYKETLEELGLPMDLAYLPIIESGYNIKARSRAGAVGIWQFIRGTARRYQLKVGKYVDERRDPILSFYAAINYLKDLYSMFGRWDLALAAYNAGEMRIQRALEIKSWRENKNIKELTFKDIKELLPRETQNYVPAFFASIIIAKEPHKFGLPIPQDFYERVDYFQYDSVYVKGPVSIKELASKLGLDETTFRFYNPRYTGKRTPSNEKYFYVRVPLNLVPRRELKREIVEIYLTNQAHREKISSDYIIHRVKRGETLFSISKKYGVSIEVIKQLNNIKNANYLPKGKKLKIPVNDNTNNPLDFVTHKVKKGDTLWSIARHYGVSVAEIKEINNITTSKIKAGQIIKIPLKKR